MKFHQLNIWIGRGQIAVSWTRETVTERAKTRSSAYTYNHARRDQGVLPLLPSSKYGNLPSLYLNLNKCKYSASTGLKILYSREQWQNALVSPCMIVCVCWSILPSSPIYNFHPLQTMIFVDIFPKPEPIKGLYNFKNTYIVFNIYDNLCHVFYTKIR